MLKQRKRGQRVDRTWIDKIPERLKQPLSRAGTFSATQINAVFVQRSTSPKAAHNLAN